jgi:hypothetical protein
MPEDRAARADGQELRLPGSDPVAQACHGGQRRMAEYLLALGAELNGTPSWAESTPLDAADGLDTGREALVGWLRSQGAQKSVKDAD